LQYREKDVGTVLHLPAKTIEGLFIQRLKQLWQTHNELLTTLDDCGLNITQQFTIINQAKSLAQDWDDNTPQEHINILKTCIQSVQIGCHWVELILSKAGLFDCLFKGNSVNKELKNTQWETRIRDQCPS